MTDSEVIEVWPARRGMRIEICKDRQRIWIISLGETAFDDDCLLPIDVGNLRDLVVVLDDVARKLGV